MDEQVLLLKQPEDQLVFGDVARYFESRVPSTLATKESMWVELRVVGEAVKIGSQAIENSPLDEGPLVEPGWQGMLNRCAGGEKSVGDQIESLDRFIDEGGRAAGDDPAKLHLCHLF